MPARPPKLADAIDSSCSIARSLAVIPDSWSFLLLREAFLGRRTFAEFRDELGIATDVLSARLAALVDHGVLEKVPYREPGQRTRHAYVPTAAGRELIVVLIALQQWGEAHVPTDKPSTAVPVARSSGRRVRALLVDEGDAPIAPDDARFARSDASAPVPA